MNQIASLTPIGCPKDVHFQERRNAIAAQIEVLADQMNALVAVLDRMDGDPDFEDVGDELDVSWPEGFRPFDTSLSEDAEDDDINEDSGDAEPTLGSVGHLPWNSQAFWADGAPGDHEREEENEHGGDILDDPHDGLDEDLEPNLGWSEEESLRAGPATGSEFGPGEFKHLNFDAIGYRDGLALLDVVRRIHPHRHMQHVRLSPALW